MLSNDYTFSLLSAGLLFKSIAMVDNMFYNKNMDIFDKLIVLGQNMAFEDPEVPELPSSVGAYPLVSCPLPPVAGEDHPCDRDYPIFMTTLSGGRKVPILKTLLTSFCERNCNYCFCRNGQDIPRQTFKPEELASGFMCMYRKHAVQGLFLSSGIAGGGCHTQDRLLAAAEILRLKMNFRGYLHLKLMPGAEKDQVERAMQLADRVSVNLEAPTLAYLQRLAPMKQLVEELVQPLKWVEEIRKNSPAWKGWNRRWPSSTTQFVVGAAGESDVDLLRASDYLHSHLKLRRVYFSGFQPVPGTPLENCPPANPWRRIRLYQADFLLRDYQFTFEDFPYARDGNLPLQVDPKLAWAQENLSQMPLEVNRAEPRELLRIPGIGLKGAGAILAARRKGRLKGLDDLRALGIRCTERLAPFILVDGRRPEFQPSLW